MHGSETRLASFSFMQGDAEPPPPEPRRFPRPRPSHQSLPLIAQLRVTSPGSWRGAGAQARWPGGRTESDLPAPVSASPPAPPPSAPGCRLEPECPTRGRPWAPRAPRTWAAPRYDPAWPLRAWSPPASEQRPRPGRAKHRARASPCPPPQRGAAGECPPTPPPRERACRGGRQKP